MPGSNQNFANCLPLILSYEGGYVDHPKDPGGATNMGITQETLSEWRGHPVTKDDVKNLTNDEAAKIYRKNYWDRVCGDSLPAGLGLCVFDAAVNSGVKRAAQWLQAVAGVPQDGVIGPQTVAAACKLSALTSIADYQYQRLRFLQGLSTWATFGKGWGDRVVKVQEAALKMAKGA